MYLYIYELIYYKHNKKKKKTLTEVQQKQTPTLIETDYFIKNALFLTCYGG